MKVIKPRKTIDLELMRYKQERSIDDAFKENGITDNRHIYEMHKNYRFEDWEALRTNLNLLT